MKVKEKKIDIVLEWVEKDPKFSVQLEEQFHRMNSEVKAYLFHSVEDTLNKTEKEFFVFVLQVLWYCLEDYIENGLVLQNFQDIEEENWKIAESHKTLEAKFDAFFVNYKEEDLLAFVEDLLGDEEISIPGKEIIFVLSKSLIDQII